MLLLVSIIPLSAGSTGKIRGRIIDTESKQPLVGVNIYLSGTAIGTASNGEGSYLIINIPAATYTVVVSYVGYKTIKMNDVVINADRTTTLDFDMNVAAVEGEEVIVEAKRPVIVKDQTATTTTVESATINNMPVNNITDVLSTMAGVLEQHGGNYIVGGGYHFRGGRAGEITYLVDGFVVEDALYGDMGLDISRNAISEISMITGAFNAEYGEATSGVINIVTKEGKSDYSWNLRGVSDLLLNPSYHNQGLSRMEATFSGPLLPSRPNLATIFFNGDILDTRTSMWKNKLPWDILKQDVDGDGVYDESDGDIVLSQDLAVTGSHTVTGATILNGAVTLGDASADAVAINGTATFTPSADFDGGFTVAASQTIDMGGNQIVNVADPTAAQAAATKAYVDAVKTGLNVKDAVKLASTTALAASTYANGSSGVGATLTANANGALSLDSVAVSTSDRVLIKNQADASQNGIYTVTNTGGAGAAFVLTRATDADTSAEMPGGSFAFVEQGSALADNGFVFTHNGSPTIGTTDLTVAQFSGAGQIDAGAGLTKSGNTLAVQVDDSSIEISSDTLQVKATGITNAMLAGSIDLTAKVTGILPVANGGTGASSLTANRMLISNGTSAITVLAAGTAGQVMTSNGGSAPAFGDIDGGTY